MYAWSFAVARLKLVQDMPQPPKNPLMVQPPADKCVPSHSCNRSSAQAAVGPQELGLGIDIALHLGASCAQQVWRSGLGGARAMWPAHDLRLTHARHARSLISARTAADSMRQGRDAWSAYRSRRYGRRGCICRCGASGARAAWHSLTRPAQPFFENGAPVTPEGLELMRLLVHTFNAAVDTLPELPKARADSDALAQALAERSFGTRASLIVRWPRRRHSRRRRRSALQTRCSAP